MNNHESHVTDYNAMMIVTEANRCSRSIKGLELTKAKATGHRLSMAAMGISSTNLVFDSGLSLVQSYTEFKRNEGILYCSIDPLFHWQLAKDVIEILKDNPEGDDSVMTPHIPSSPLLNADTGVYIRKPMSSIKTSNASRALSHDLEDDCDTGLIDELKEDTRSNSAPLIDNLIFYVDEKQCWRGGFDAIKFTRQEHLQRKAFLNAAIPEENLTKRGKVTTRRKRRPSRITAKHRAMTGLLA